MAATTEHGERLSRIEGAYEHLATKADIASTKADITRLEGKLNVAIMVMVGGFGILIPLILTQG